MDNVYVDDQTMADIHVQTNLIEQFHCYGDDNDDVYDYDLNSIEFLHLHLPTHSFS